MDIKLKDFSIADATRLEHYSNLRPVYTSERQFVNQLIWENYYKTKYYYDDNFLMYVVGKNDNNPMMPLCKEEDIVSVFLGIKEYWNDTLLKPLNMYLIDQTFLDKIKTIPGFSEEFEIEDARDSYDYIYDAEKLRTLSGRAFHKKKNHLNSFLKNYEGRYRYETLCCKDIGEIMSFHETWLADRDYEDNHGSIRSEEDGINKVFQNCGFIDCSIGGVYVDDKLEAYSIGTYAPEINCAFIHIEKANTSIPGLYNYINQQFLIHSFPDAIIVNREDDLGQEGLRKAKLSYNPIRLEAKYHIFQKNK